MKKVYNLIFIVLIFLLTCCRSDYKYDCDKLVNNVEKIEIIELNYPQSEYEATILYTLDSDENNELLSDLSKIKVEYPFGDPPTMDGYSKRIFYKNQEYEVISRRGTKRYSKDGKEIAWYKRQCSK